MKHALRSAGLGLISFSLPFFLVMTAIRLWATPLFPQVEYRMPYFPADTYGFTLQDRLKWSTISFEYMFTNTGISFLADQRIDAGTPLYNERELSHMLDVKNLAQAMIRIWTVLAGVYILLIGWAWWKKWFPSLGRAAANGGKLTIALVVLILGGVAVSFNWLFTEFHRIFFSGDSWLFLYSDTLIRLFPIPFWRDTFILVGGLTILGAVLLIIVGGRLERSGATPTQPPPKSRSRF